MTSDDWQSTNDPDVMLNFLLPHYIGSRVGGQLPNFEVTDRQLRLFACGCGRQVWHKLTPVAQDRIAKLEAALDDRGKSDLLRIHPIDLVIDKEWLLSILSRPSAEVQANLLRDIFGNPFQQVEMDSDLLSWNNGAISGLARTIYGNFDFDAMPVLGDALEEAGCKNKEILNHCRSSITHARGCWVLDMIIPHKS